MTDLLKHFPANSEYAEYQRKSRYYDLTWEEAGNYSTQTIHNEFTQLAAITEELWRTLILIANDTDNQQVKDTVKFALKKYQSLIGE